MDIDTWEQFWEGLSSSRDPELAQASFYALTEHESGTGKGDDLRVQLRKSIQTDDMSHLRKWLVEWDYMEA